MSLYKKIKKIKDHQAFRKEFETFKSMSKGERFTVDWKDRYPCLDERTPSTGFEKHYIYHPAWAARVLAETRPKEHIDISSSLFFVSIASAFVPMKFYDYRPADLRLTNLTTDSADLFSLPFKDGSVDSLSCMHVIEHVGLGRYGDRLDPDGDLKAISELKRVLAEKGSLLFVVPIGKPRVMFNAHRIYSYDRVMDCFKDLNLREFTLIPDKPKEAGLVRNPSKELLDAQVYGCGCFWFVK